MDMIKKHKVLVVDDYPDIRFTLSTLISRKTTDCSVATADSGEQAIELLRDGGFDIVFMDIMMQGISGIQAAQMIRTELKSNVPIVFVTAKVDEQTKNTCKDISPYFIEKPFVWDQIQETLTAALK